MAVKVFATSSQPQQEITAPSEPSRPNKVREALKNSKQKIFDHDRITDCVASYFGHLNEGLNWKQRPSDLQARISHAFTRIAKHTSCQWYYNGALTYEICSVDEQALVKRMILEASETQKDFYFLDIGAGNFQWCRSLASYIQEEVQPPSDITIHIVGIRGEAYDGQAEAFVYAPNIKLHLFGSFMIEELESEFEKRDLHLEGRISLAVSNWSMRHLADPSGTFSQIYDLLRPGTGLFLTDGFFFLSETEPLLERDADETMVAFLNETGAPFLMQNWAFGGSLNHYAILRPNAEPCHLNMSYAGIETEVPGGLQVGSCTVTRFKKERQDQLRFAIDYADPEKGKTFLYGDATLFQWLKARELFVRDQPTRLNYGVKTWKPLKTNL